LTPSEYRILATLVQRPGQVYSRAQLLDALGDAALDNYERTVDTHIKSLRAKLRAVLLTLGLHDANDTTDPIETHRGFGYCVRAGR
jgi:two-component system catabolic regulation response regulator CreB